MPEPAPGTEVLKLKETFPPVPTAEWEAVIHEDLKGADYEKRLVWRTPEGLAVRPYYRAENVDGKAAPVRAGGRAWEPVESLPAGAIRADELHEAGATAVQELGYALAAGVEQFAKTPGPVNFVFAVGSAYFMEIAKLRAARVVWAQAVAAFGAKPEQSSLTLYARTSRRNKSTYDRYTDLLRATTETMSAVIGGADRVAVEAFGFDAHLSENLPRLLTHEAHLDKVVDPAGGSYYIEVLTDSVARAAWKLFQQVEAEGGYAAALASGSVARTVAVSRAALEKAVSGRRQALVGVNNFPDLKEKTTDVAAPGAGEKPALSAFRLAEPFERIRVRTARHAAKTGKYPVVLLLTRGDLKMRMARANFSLNFFGCTGFDVVESPDYEGTAADLIVLCSSDPEYLAFAQEVCSKVKVPVVVAGNPKDQIAALEQAGVQGFIHVASDAVATLTQWQDRLGMEA